MLCLTSFMMCLKTLALMQGKRYARPGSLLPVRLFTRSFGREQARPPCFAAGLRPLASLRHTGGLRAAASGSRELLTVEQAQRALDLQASRSAHLRADAPAAPAPGPRCCSARALHQLCNLALCT